MKFYQKTSELLDKSFDHDEYKELREELKKSCTQFTEILFPNENINLSFSNLRDITNVYCEGNEIKINKQLLLFIDSHLTEKYLSNIPTSKNINKKLVRKSIDSIRKLAIEFIILHEISHIYLGHLKIKNDNKKYEYYKESIEFDADRIAANLLFGKLLMRIKKSGIKDYQLLIEGFIFILFEVICTIYKQNNPNYSDLDILKRITIISTAFAETKNKDTNNGITDISLSEIKRIIFWSVIKFIPTYHRNFKNTKLDKLDFTTFVKVYLEKSTLYKVV